MYSRWKDWDGKALDSPPLFYEVDEQAVDFLERVNDEVVVAARRIMALRPDVDLSQVIPNYEWDIACYGKDIGDPTNLMTTMRTNSGYAGITHPMVEPELGRYAPDFRHRFLSEDVPFGLVVLRGVAEIAGNVCRGFRPISVVGATVQTRLGFQWPSYRAITLQRRYPHLDQASGCHDRRR